MIIVAGLYFNPKLSFFGNNIKYNNRIPNSKIISTSISIT